ncbi:TPA: hypothetical protein ACRR0L_001004 [Klebsiella quasipneumoniae]
MTDITELAQSLKAAAEKWQEAWGKYDKVEITIAEFIRAANQYESIVKDPANVIELVEALEKAQQHIAVLDAELEREREKSRRVMSRIAELESRTVKLPELCVGVVQGGHAVMVPYPAGHWFNKTAILEMLAAAGTKVEAE